MKQIAASFVVTGALLLAILVLGRSNVNSLATAVNGHCTVANCIWADGSNPMPPFPPPVGPGSSLTASPLTLLADGSNPMPPFPPPVGPGSSLTASPLTLWADGSNPMPPFPPPPPPHPSLMISMNSFSA